MSITNLLRTYGLKNLVSIGLEHDIATSAIFGAPYVPLVDTFEGKANFKGDFVITPAIVFDGKAGFKGDFVKTPSIVFDGKAGFKGDFIKTPAILFEGKAVLRGYVIKTPSVVFDGKLGLKGDFINAPVQLFYGTLGLRSDFSISTIRTFNSTGSISISGISNDTFISNKPTDTEVVTGSKFVKKERLNISKETIDKLFKQSLLDKAPKIALFTDYSEGSLNINGTSFISNIYVNSSSNNISFDGNSEDEYIDKWYEIRMADEEFFISLN